MSRLSGGAGASRASLGVYLASLALMTTIACQGAIGLFNHMTGIADEILTAPQDAPQGRQSAALTAKAKITVSTKGQVALTQDWLDRIKTNEFWSGRGGSGGGGPSPYISRGSQRESADTGPSRFDERTWANDEEGEPTYRTVCVRLCDGYFWPVSFATTEAYFDRDRAQCERGCGTPAKLYVYRNPGADPEAMHDLQGQPYSRLPTAFQFRTKFEPTCKCNAHPWEAEAQNRHKLYALDTARRNGSKVAAREAEQLKAKMDIERRAQVLAHTLVQSKGPPVAIAEIGQDVVLSGRTLAIRRQEADPTKGATASSGPKATGTATAAGVALADAPVLLALPIQVLPVQALSVLPSPKAKNPSRTASSGSNSRPAGIMRAGVTRSSTGGGGSGSGGSGSSGSRSATSSGGGDWRGVAFRGN